MAQFLKNIYGHNIPRKKLFFAIKNKHLPHAMLFSGPSGVGKKKTAFALAQTLICERQSQVEHTACGECFSCMALEKGKSQHILFIQPEGLHIKVDSVRQIWKYLSLQSFAPARVIIIDCAHQMNLQSANSLLKILEEPPPNVYFILISSLMSSLPVTVRSRLQVLRFLPLQPEDLHKILKETQTDMSFFDSENQWMIKAVQGSLDNFEKWMANRELRVQAFKLLGKTLRREGLCSLGELADLIRQRDQALFVCLCWQQILRDAFMMKFNFENEVIHQDQRELLKTLQVISPENLILFFQKTIQMEWDLKKYVDPALVFDNLLISANDFFNFGE